MRNLNKKKFLFCYPHTLTIGLEAPVYRGFRGEGKGEGRVRREMANSITPPQTYPYKKA